MHFDIPRARIAAALDQAHRTCLAAAACDEQSMTFAANASRAAAEARLWETEAPLQLADLTRAFIAFRAAEGAADYISRMPDMGRDLPPAAVDLIIPRRFGVPGALASQLMLFSLCIEAVNSAVIDLQMRADGVIGGVVPMKRKP